MVITIDDVDQNSMLMSDTLLPKQLDAIRPASEMPAERHRWNTNEVCVQHEEI